MDYLPPPEPAIEYQMTEQELAELNPYSDFGFDFGLYDPNSVTGTDDNSNITLSSDIDFETESSLESVVEKEFEPGKFLGRPVTGVGFGAGLVNDGMILTSDAIFPFLPDWTDDDFGYTHGSALTVYMPLTLDQYLTLNWSSDLYTVLVKPNLIDSEGRCAREQYFMNVDKLGFTIDNHFSSSNFTSGYGFGIMTMNSVDEGSFLDAAVQQKILHIIVNDNGVDVPINIPGNIENSGLYFDYDFRYGDAIPLNVPNLRLYAGIDGGVFMSTIPGTSYVDLGFNASLAFQENIDSLGLKAILSSDFIFHEGGIRPVLSAGIILGNDKFSIQTGISKKYGNSLPAFIYDLPNKSIGEHDIEFNFSLNFSL